MSKTKTVLIAVSDEQCNLGNVNLKMLMNIAMRIERRMEGKVQIEDEQRRYNIYCNRIEFYGHQLYARNMVESSDLGYEYLDLVFQLKNMIPDAVQTMRLTANFCRREALGEYLAQFEALMKSTGNWERNDVQKKRAFYQKAKAAECNVIELMQTWVSPAKMMAADQANTEDLKAKFLSLPVSDSITLDKGGGHFMALINQINKVVDQTKKGVPAAVNFSDIRHDVITEILHNFVYQYGKPMEVPITYGDGSEASPFPLFCLKTKSEEALNELRKGPVLGVGMMSARHANDGLDFEVKTYWFRNQEISTGRTQAEIDKVAYKKSKELFESLRSEGPYRIAFYQTGFQPALVGFLRALAEELRYREAKPPSLEVMPYYFMGEKYKAGKIWC